MYKPKYFKIEEFVPKHVYEERGDKAIQLMDERIIISADQLKHEFQEGTMSINTWLWDGDRNWSGLRTPDSPWYRPYSQHTFGRAIDAVFSDYSAEEVRKYIIKNKDQFPFINFLEMNVDWVHFDCRNCKRIYQYIP